MLYLFSIHLQSSLCQKVAGASLTVPHSSAWVSKISYSSLAKQKEYVDSGYISMKRNLKAFK